MTGASASSYRPEIDGLRALAVLPVVFYHFGIGGFSGGFVGVDIFFVISGFLIGGILWEELHNTGRVALGRFFMRRVRRLAPAYLAVGLATLIGAWFILLPFDFREFGQELIAATVYLANVHFFNEAGYFDQASDRKLLLHTWSLAVEEQFYLVLPTLMLVLAAWKRHLPWILIGLGVVSFVACLWMMRWSQPAAFYLFPFRAWELLAGVCLAITARQTGWQWRGHSALSWIGLGLIIAAVTLFKAGTHFPGVYALVPVVGAVLVIANGRDPNPVNRMLSSGPFLFFGLISYSLYLWHWPMVTLLTYYRGDLGVGPALTAVLFVAAIAVSWLSWRLIETPVRRGAWPGLRLLVGYGVAAAALVGVAFSFAFSDGWPERFAPESRAYISATREFHQDWSRCETPQNGSWAGLEICPIGPEGPPQVLIWADSHGRAFKEGLERLSFERDVPGLLIWQGGCPPLVGIHKAESVSSPADDAACAAAPDIIQAGLAQSTTIDTVLLVGRWAYYETGIGVGRDAKNSIRLMAAQDTQVPQSEVFSTAMRETLADMAGSDRRVFVLRQVPEIPNFSAGTAARSLAYGRLSTQDIEQGIGRAARDLLEARFVGADRAIDAAATAIGATVIDLWPDLCDAETCFAVLDGQPVYFDNNHVTNTGALILRSRFDAVFAGAG